MIQQDAERVLTLHKQIETLETRMAEVAANSNIAQLLSTMPGFGPITTAELAGEIGTIERFESESSLALYGRGEKPSRDRLVDLPDRDCTISLN